MTQERILIIEDEPDILSMISLRLQNNGYEVRSAETGTTGLRLISDWCPDLALLDLVLPELSGLEILRWVRSNKQFDQMPILIISALGEENDVVVGLELGADDYLSKPFKMSILTAHVNALLRRTKINNQNKQPEKITNIITFGKLNINTDTYQVHIENKQIILTGTEYKLLVTLLNAKGRVLTRNQLINNAIGNSSIVIDRTIDVHLASLRNKLGNMRNIIETVRGVGYRICQ
jgi:two-component system phosphate regulon response regulator PhoB